MKKKVVVDKEESEEDEPNSNSQNGDNEKDVKKICRILLAQRGSL